MRTGALVLKRESWEPVAFALVIAGPHRDRDRLLNSIWSTAIIIGPALVLELLVGLGLALLLTRIASL